VFLKIRHDIDDSSLVEVLNLKQLFDPFAKTVSGRLHAGEELQDAAELAKAELSFPSGEKLPLCWLDPHYCS
jgi:hypothetical protein